jgi:cation diffusion facilitator CzcD-associated flavoprotein CzcO
VGNIGVHCFLMATIEQAPKSNAGGERTHFRVAIVGTGFAGLGMAIRLKQEGIEDFVVFERADDVGGTWRDNTYPGCQCDVPSHLYSFSFAPNPDWSRTFSQQPEIQDYLRRCAAHFDVLPHVRFRHAVTAARWDDERQLWEIETSGGGGAFTAQVLVAGMGGLSEPSIPQIPGLDSFEGAAFHTAQWNHDVDLRGRRVAVIGTGASSIQVVPEIQPEVEKLHLFQRTPAWIMPHPDRPLSKRERTVYRRFPLVQRLVRGAIYWARETFVIPFVRPRFASYPEGVARKHIARQVPDRELRRKLTPSYTIGCKRILISNDYYPAVSKDNVELITEGIKEIRPRSIVTVDGREVEVDVIVLGTGFRIRDMPAAHVVTGRTGRTLAETWNGSMAAYLGTSIAGFPNLFMLVGPNTGLGHNSIVFMIESQVEYVLDALRTMDARGLDSVDVREEAQEAFNSELQERLRGTVWSTGGCASWYLDDNGRNTTLWPGSTWPFRRRTRRFDPGAYTLRAGRSQRTYAQA